AMYGAKTEGGGVAFYRPELRVAVTEQMRLESDLKRGLERHEFQLHYQPVFHLLTGQMVGAEALSRWRHFSRGMVDASEFIGLAERSGLIRSLDRWAIARAVHQRRAQLDGTWIGWVAVNVSPLSLSDPDLPAYVREVLDAAELEPGSLVLELPAGAALADADAADLMWELKDTGAAIALDDFGAGSTSFARLKRLPVDILKLHPDFAAGIGRGEGDEQMLQGTIAIAHGLRSKVLAKGVERDEQLEWLRDAGCDFIQGYLLGEPVPADRLGPSAPSEVEEAARER
ncbi:MAG: EAL domain-containing protein, partial [Gemmatimonadota bacterium]